MPSYDHALKDLLMSEGASLFQRLSGSSPKEWLNVELPTTRAPRVDLVSWLDNGRLFHLEFQSFNDPGMGWRMLEYYALLAQRHGTPPLQAVLYVGNEPLRMAESLKLENLEFKYGVSDIRIFGAEELLASRHVGDHVLAILCDQPAGNLRVRRVIERLAELPPERRLRAVRLLLILSILRGLGGEVERQVESMGLVIDVLSDPYFRELYERKQKEAAEEGWRRGIEKGLAEGLAEGIEKGIEQGRTAGEVSVLRKMLARRFGNLPPWAELRLASAREPDLERWALEILTAGSLEEVFN